MAVRFSLFRCVACDAPCNPKPYSHGCCDDCTDAALELLSGLNWDTEDQGSWSWQVYETLAHEEASDAMV